MERALAGGSCRVVSLRVRRARRSADRAWAGPAVAYAIVLCALFPAGVGQIRSVPAIVEPVEYPAYWFRTAEYVGRAVPADDPILVLPWHLYQPLGVSEGRLVANPARVVFPGRLIVPQNLEIPGRFSEVSSRYDRIGLAVGREESSLCALARTLRNLEIRWVLVLDGAESAETMSRLRACDYSLVEGRQGFTGVLRDARSSAG